MKNSPLTTFLIAVLAVSALLSVIFCAFYISSSRQRRSLEGQVEAIKKRNQAITLLAGEAVEYSKRDTNIDPILVWANLKQGKSPPSSTNKASSK